MKRIVTSLVAVLFIVAGAKAQNVTTNSGSGLAATYADLASAITALNGATITSPVVITLTAAETAPAGGYVITASGTSTNTITINGGSNTVTASAALTVGAVNDAIFKLKGADYITLQNFTMQENAANTATTAASNNMTEWGVALLYATTTNGSQNNTIKNNTISLNRTYANTFGIYSSTRHADATPGTAAEASSSAGANSSNKFYGNSISNVNFGIVLIGASVTANMDNGNDVGGSSATTGNTITNWGNGGAASTFTSLTANNYCIFANQQINENVSYNTITSASIASAVTEGGILKNYSVGLPTGTITATYSNNTVTVTNNPTAATTGGIVGITTQGISTFLSTATVNITNNVVQNCIIGGSTSTTNGVSCITNTCAAGTVNITGNSMINNQCTAASSTGELLTGISNSGAGGTVNINLNIFRGFSTTSAGGQVQVIRNSAVYTTALNVNNNQLGNATGGLYSNAAAWTNTIFGILTTSGGASAALSIQNNDFRGITLSNASSTGSLVAIRNDAATLSQIISTNTFTNLTFNTAGSVTFIQGNTVSASGTQTVNNNSIVTGFSKTQAGGTIRFFSSIGGSPSSVTETQTGNNFSNITLTGATTLQGWFNQDWSSATNAPVKIIDNNTFSNITGGNPITSILNVDGAGATSSVSTNTITNVAAEGAVTAVLVGSTGGATTLNVNSNIINTISSTLGGDVIAISNANGSTTENISLNTIHTLSTVGTTNSVTGIANTGGTGTVINIFRNKIYNLSNTGAATSTPAVNGVLISGGNAVNTYNNLIGDLKAAAANSTDAIRGISVTSTATAVYNVYYNTVYITGTSSGTNFGTSGVYHAASSVAGTATLSLRNNIIFNNAAAKGSGLTVAFRRSSGNAGDLANYASASNNNDFYAGTPGASNLIYSDGVATAQTLANYTGGTFTAGTVAPRDGASISEDPEFQSIVGSSVDFLKFKVSSPKQIEKGGSPIGGYTTDYAGTSRNASNPDIGAWELAGIPADQTPPTVTVLTPNYSCGSGAITLTATVTDPGGVPQSGANVPVLYYKVNSGSYSSPIQATYSGGIYSFSGVGAGSVLGDVISYYIVAQDTYGNVAASPSGGAVVTANPPLATTPPTTPSTYTNLNTLTGTYTVGAGGDYATLTAAVAAYNNSCLSGTVTFSLTDALYSTSETFPIVINGRGSLSAQLIIKPATGVSPVITGSTATGQALIKLDGADYVTIQGSLASATLRDLTISNTSTAANTAAIWISSQGTGAGATNNTIKNLNINAGSNSVTSTFGIYIGGTSISTSGTGDDNNTVTISTNVISKAYYGIYSRSSATGPNQDLSITNNFIGSATASSYIGNTGILLGQLKTPIISGNTITNIIGTSTAPTGVQVLTGVQDASITGNTISNIQYTGTSGSGAVGINVTGTAGGNGLIANNMIYSIVSDGDGSNVAGASPFGIAISGGSAYNVYYNSVWMYGNRASNAFTSAVSAGLYIGAATSVLDVRNNIFYNSMTSSNTSAGTNYAVYSASANTAFTNINNNDYYSISTTAGVTKAIGFLGSNRLDMTAWRTATGKDVNSFTGDPQFVSSTNLHISNSSPTQVESAGVAIGGITTDFDGDTRNASTPDVGADEGSFTAKTCFEPTAATATPTFGSTSISWTAPTQGTPTGYEWEIRTAGFGGAGAFGLAASGTTTAPTTSGTVNTLGQQVTYTFYVRTNCGAGDYSQWVQGSTFTTPCNLKTIPLLEGFNSNVTPNCWSKQDVGTNVTGTGVTFPNSGNNPTTQPYEGSNMVQFDSYNGSVGREVRLVTAPLTTSGQASGLKVQFFWRNSRNDAYTASDNALEGMQVQYSLDGTNWTDVPSGFFTRHDATLANGTAAWKQKSVALPAAAHNQPVVYVGFKFHSQFGDYMFMDAVGVVAPCSTAPNAPTAMTYPSVGVTSLTGSFTASNADGYLVVIYPAGSTPTAPTNGTDYTRGDVLGTGNVVRSSAFTTFNATQLAPSTGYDVYVYPYYNTSCYGGPLYGTSPLISNVTTAACTGPVPTTVNIGSGQSYTNLTSFLPVLTACGVQGNTIVALNSDYDPYTEVYPLDIGPIGSGATAASPSQTVTIRPAATITSTLTISTPISPVIDLDGVKYLTIDGSINGNGASRSMDIISTGSGEAITLENDAQNNVLLNLNIKSNNTSGTNGVINIAGTTGLSATSGNSNNTITKCGINGNGVSPNAIWAAGSAAPADNKSNVISNNDIYDYYANIAGVNNVGIYLAGNNAVTANTNWTISGNSFYQTATRSYSNLLEPTYISAIAADFSPRGAFNITGNYFGGSAPQAGGTPWTGTSGGTGTYVFNPIYLFDNSTTATNITNNVITNISYSTLSSSFYSLGGIMLNAGFGTISGNTIGSATTPGAITMSAGSGTTAGLGSGINLGNGVNQSASFMNVTNNTVAGITVQGTSASTPCGFYGIIFASAVTLGAPSDVTGNTIGTTAAGISNPSTGALANNLIGMFINNAGTFNINGNNISNISSNGTGAGIIRGILAQTGTNNIGTLSNPNIISNLRSPAASTSLQGAVVGIVNSSTLATNQVIAYNQISGIRSTSTAATSIYTSGISAGSTSSTGVVYKNKIWDITNTSVGTNGLIAGFIALSNAASQAWTISNNMISLSNASNTNNIRVAGIYDSITGGTRKYYFNSVYIGGSSAGTLPSYAFYRAYQATTSTIDVQNNLLVNTRTSSGSNYAIANRASTVPPTTGWTSNYNVLNAPDPNKIGCWGPTGSGGDKTFAAWRIITSGVGSYSGIPVTFVDATNGDLHLNMGVNSTPIESGGSVGSTGITDDIDGQSRPGGGGTSNGGGTAADIGADEFNGKPLDIDMGATAVAVPSGGCFTSSQTIAIRIKNYGGTLIGFTSNPVTVSGTIVNPSSVSTPFSMLVSTGALNAGQTLDVNVLTGYDMSAAGNYVINATAVVAGDENNGNDAMPTVTKASVAVAAGSISSSTLGYCGTSGKPTFTLTGSAGGDIQWQQSTTAGFTTPVNVGTLNTTTYTTPSNVASGTTYFRALTSCGATSLPSNVIAITFTNPSITTSNKSRCGTGTVTLTATPSAGATAVWYNSATGGVPRATGNSFTTLSLTADTSYYVSASSTPLDKVGVSATATNCGTIATTSVTDQVLRFNTTGPVTLVSAYVIPQAQGPFTVALRAAGSSTNLQLYSTAFVLAQVGIPQQVPLNFVIPTSGSYQLSNTLGGSAQIASYTCGYPKNNTSGTFSIVGSAASSTGTLSTTTYNSFFDLVVADGSYCETPRQQVNVTVSTPPALALDASSVTVCSGGSGTTVHVTAGTVGNYTIYKWSPTTGASPGGTPNGRDLFINPSSNATYTLTASGGGPSGQCINTAQVTVAVVPIPATPVVSSVLLCSGATATAMTISNAVTTVTSAGAPSGVGNQATINFTNTSGDEGGNFTNGKVIGRFSLPALPAGAIITKAGFDIPNIVLLAGNNASSIRLGIKSLSNTNVTTTGYQGATTGVTPNPATYTTVAADQTTIAGVIPIAGGTFNVIYYSSINNTAGAQDVTFPATGSFFYEYTVPVTYNWYTSQYGNTPIATGTSFNPIGVAGSGITNNTTAATAKFWVTGVASSLCPTTRSSTQTATYTVGARPLISFTAAPTAQSCQNVPITYTTQAGQFQYVWTVSGVLNTDYQITAGGTGSTSNTVTLKWLTTGTKTVTVNYNYSQNGCNAVSPASNTTTIGNYAAPTVTVSGNTTTCYGAPVTYVASPVPANGTYTYQWKKDGVNVGNNTATYVDPGTTATTGVGITVTITATVPCAGSAQVTSTPKTLTITPNQWTGTASADFSNPNNWCAGVVPSGAANVLIPSGATNMPRLSKNVSFGDLNIATGATLNLNGYAMTIGGVLSGTGYIQGFSGYPAANDYVRKSTLIFTKASGSVGTLYMDPSFKGLGTLSFSGASSLALANGLDIYESADVGNATLTTNDNLTIKSVQAITGRIGQIGTGDVTGNVSVERWLPAVSRKVWRLLSAPTQGQTIKQAWMENAAPLANPNPGYGAILTSQSGVGNGYDAQTAYDGVLTWNGSAFVLAGSSSTVLSSIGTGGYLVYTIGDRSITPASNVTGTTTLRSKGTIYKGSVSVSSIPAGQSTVIGNVYASAIDFTQLTTNMNAFSLWDPLRAGSGSATLSTGPTGALQTFSSVNGWAAVPGGGSYSINPVNTIIQSGQAFVVSPATTGTLTFTESAKTLTGKNLMRTVAVKRVKATLYGFEASSKAPMLLDGNVTVFNNSCQAGLDENDVVKMALSGESLGISNSSKSLVIDARPEVVSTDEIQYTTGHLQVDHEYQLEFITENLDPALTAYVIDNYLKTKTQIKLNTTELVTFTVTTDGASRARNRFKLVFKKPAITATQKGVATGESGYTVAPNPVMDGNVLVQFNNQPAGKYTVRLLNTTGQAVYQQVIEHGGGNSSNRMRLPGKLASGLYKLEIVQPGDQPYVTTLVIGNAR